MERNILIFSVRSLLGISHPPSNLIFRGQADTIVPNAGDSAAYDRYAYVKNNPVRYSDPSGHMYSCGGVCGGDTRPYLSWAQGTGQILTLHILQGWHQSARGKPVSMRTHRVINRSISPRIMKNDPYLPVSCKNRNIRFMIIPNRMGMLHTIKPKVF